MVGIAYDEESKTEITDEGLYEDLHIYGFPADIIPAVNKYNREHPGPDGNAINITQTCIDALRDELRKRERPDIQEYPLQSMTHIPNVGPVELKRAAYLIKGMGFKPQPEDIDGNKLEIGDTVGFTIAGPDAHNYLQGTVCEVDAVYYVDCGNVGRIRIDNDLLNLHKLTEDAESDDEAQTGDEMEYNGKSIYLCPIHAEAITEMEYEHLYVKGHCKVCDRPLVRYDKVNLRP